MHKLLVSVHWFEFEDQFAICSSRWQMIETNFHFWIQTQFILKDYCWNPQLVEVAGPSSPDSQTRGMAFLLLSASATTESSEDHFKLQTKVIFSTRVKTERAETRGTEAILTLFSLGAQLFIPTILVSDNFQVGTVQQLHLKFEALNSCLFSDYLHFLCLFWQFLGFHSDKIIYFSSLYRRIASGDRGQERDFAQTDCGMRAEGTGHRRANI